MTQENLFQYATEKSKRLWNEIQQNNLLVNSHINQMDNSINEVVKNLEYEYLQAYNLFVKHKVTEIKELIDQITQRIGDKVANDKKLQKLQDSERLFRNKSELYQKQSEELQREVEKLQKQVKSEKESKDFYHKSALESKKQKKLLKVALTRLEQEHEEIKLKYNIVESDIKKSTSINQNLGIVNSIERKYHEQSSFNDLKDEENKTFLTAMKKVSLPIFKNSLNYDKLNNQSSIGLISNQSSPSTKIQHDKTLDSILFSRRHNSIAHPQRYAQGLIPTENLKFQQFVQVVFGSHLSQEEMKSEILRYVETMETNYNDKITKLQIQLDKQKKAAQYERIKNMGENQNKTDLEQFFVQTVEDMRKEIMKRRIKTEISNTRSKPLVNPYNNSNVQNQESQREFDETLVKLADLTKGRVKIEEFTYNDRTTVLDLFVNNEKVLLKIYEILFPIKTVNLKQLQNLKNPNDKITLGSDFKMQNARTMMTVDTSLREFESRPDFLFAHSSEVKSQRNAQSFAKAAPLTTIDRSLISIQQRRPSMQGQQTVLENKQNQRLPSIQTPQASTGNFVMQTSPSAALFEQKSKLK